VYPAVTNDHVLFLSFQYAHCFSHGPLSRKFHFRVLSLICLISHSGFSFAEPWRCAGVGVSDVLAGSTRDAVRRRIDFVRRSQLDYSPPPLQLG